MSRETTPNDRPARTTSRLEALLAPLGPRRLHHYGIAILFAAAAVWFREILVDLLGREAPYLTVYPLVIFLPMFLGLRPAVPAILISILGIEFFVTQSIGTFDLSPVHLARSTVMLGCCVFVGIIRDRLDARTKEIVRTEKRLSIAQRTAGLGIYEYDARSGKIEWDLRVRELWGVTPNEAITLKTLESGIHPEDLKLVRDTIRTALAPGGENRYSVEYRVINRADHREHWIMTSGQPYFDHAVPVGVIGAVQDVTERKKTNEALAEAANRFRTLADNISQLLWMADEQGHRFWFNRRWYDYTGSRAEDSLGEGWKSAHHPNYLKLFETRILEGLKSGQAWQETVPLRSKTGEYRWFLIKVTPIRDDSGRVIRWFGTDTDITELRETQERVRFFSAALENSSQPFGAGNTKGNIIAFNSAFLSLTGYSADELRTKTWVADLTPPEWREREARVLEEVRLTGEPRTYEKEYIRKDGRRLPIELKVHLVRNADGSPAYYYAFITDITDRKRSEAALRESEERFRTLADNISQFAWMADSHGDIFWYNKRWIEYTGARLPEMKALGWQRILHPDHLERVTIKLTHCFKTGEDWEDTFPIQGRDGKYRWFLSRAVPVRDETGRVIRWFGTNTDITEQLDALRTRDDFLSIASHELKTPLTAIQLQIQNQERMLRKANTEPLPIPRLERSSTMISKELKRLAILVDDLLDVSRITTGRLTLNIEPTDLSNLLETILAREDAHLKNARIQVDKQIAGGITAPVDRLRIDQVVTNLISNAIKYAPGAPLDVILSKTDNRVKIIIQDHGPGIPSGLEKKIFERYERAVRGATAASGLGLGLYISKQIIEAHGGFIRVVNTPGTGACFSVELPIAQETRLPLTG